MDLILFVIGYLLAAFRLNVGVVDILPDVVGFALLILCGILLIRKKKLPAWSVAPLLIGLICSILILVLEPSVIWLILYLTEQIALLVWMYVLFGAIAPGAEKGSVQQIRKQSLRMAQIIVLLLVVFGGLLSLTTALTVILVLLEALLVLYVIVAVSRDWPGRTV